MALRFVRRAATSSRPPHGWQPASPFHGVWPILATPFRPDESLDLECFARSVRFMADAGAAGATLS